MALKVRHLTMLWIAAALSVGQAAAQVTPPASIPVAVPTTTPCSLHLAFNGNSSQVTYNSGQNFCNYLNNNGAVTLSIEMSILSIGTSSGTATLTGTIPTPINPGGESVGALYFSGFATQPTGPNFFVQQGSPIGLFDSSNAALTDANFGTNTILAGTVTYLATP